MGDVLSAVERLERAGFSREQASAIASAAVDLLHAELATKADLALLGEQLRREMAELRAEMHEQLGRMRGEIEGLRSEMRTAIERLRAAMQTGIEGVRTELHRELGKMRSEISGLAIRIAGLLLAQTAATLAGVGLLLRFMAAP